MRLALAALAMLALFATSASAAAWRVPLGNSSNAGGGSFLTALPGGRVLAATSEGLFAYDARGRELWEKRTLPVQRGRPAAYTPVVGPDGLLYMAGPRRTVVLRPSDGSRVSAYDSLPVIEGRRWSRRVIALVGGGERVGGAFGDGVWAPQVRVLPPVAVATAPDGSVSLTAGYVAALDASGDDALAPGAVYSSVQSYDATRCPGPLDPSTATLLVALDPSTGACRWSIPMAKGGVLADTRGAIVREWAAGAGALAAYTPAGGRRWRHVATDIQPRLLARGVVVATNRAAVLALDAETGAELPWADAPRRPRRADQLRAGVVSGATVYLMWNGGYVRSAPLPRRPA